jgi:hypothetical protein
VSWSEGQLTDFRIATKHEEQGVVSSVAHGSCSCRKMVPIDIHPTPTYDRSLSLQARLGGDLRYSVSQRSKEAHLIQESVK